MASLQNPAAPSPWTLGPQAPVVPPAPVPSPFTLPAPPAAPPMAGLPGGPPITSAPAQGGGFFKDFAQASRELPGKDMNPAKLPGKIAPWAAAAGLASTVSDVTAPKPWDPEAGKDKSSDAPTAWDAPDRKSVFDEMYASGMGAPAPLGIQQPNALGSAGPPPPVSSRGPLDSRERQYFDVVNPQPKTSAVQAAIEAAKNPLKTSIKKKKDPWDFAGGGIAALPPARPYARTLNAPTVGANNMSSLERTHFQPRPTPQVRARPDLPTAAPGGLRLLAQQMGLSTGANGAGIRDLLTGDATAFNAAADANPGTISPLAQQNISRVINKLPSMSGDRVPEEEPAPAPYNPPAQAIAPPYVPPPVSTAPAPSALPPKRFGGEEMLASGGAVFQMQTGGHVFPAFDVATFGNGSTKAGQAKLAKLGGIPINGKGDGVSDSINALIDGKQKARVADGEVYFPPEAVERQGGTKKLYALMHAAEKARKRTSSGTKVKGLA